MKKLLIVLLLIVGVNVQAQKLINGDRVNMYYSQFPTDYLLLDNYKTYKLEIQSKSYSWLISKKIDMPGFRLVTSDSVADFVISIEEKWLNKSEPELRITSGGGSVKNYSYESTISAKYQIKVMLNDGTVLDSVMRNRKGHFKSKSSTAMKGVKTEYNKTVGAYNNGIVTKAIKSAMRPIREKYCFTEEKVYCSFLIFKYKKFDYSEMNNKSVEVTKLLKLEKSDENKKVVKDLVNVFLDELKAFTPDDSKGRVNEKIKAGLLYNIGLGYFYIGDYVIAYKYLKLTAEIKKQIQNCQPYLYESATINAKSTRI